MREGGREGERERYMTTTSFAECTIMYKYLSIIYIIHMYPLQLYKLELHYEASKAPSSVQQTHLPIFHPTSYFFKVSNLVRNTWDN